ncbi:YwbE family protein [Methanoregula sp.]|jgi:uncharacterized repeat protein (TIGR03833 family)|uniref:YwbE family protein n=1 Tax=Methanoregula sp. TaxID=2052170 RepID=UPI003C2290A8
MAESDDAGKHLENIKIGLAVEIFLKEDRAGKNPIPGKVREILTHSSFHPHGIMVQLGDGKIGRVQRILTEVPDVEQQNTSSYGREDSHLRNTRNNSEKIEQFLVEKGEPYCDDCLSESLSIYPRQTINQTCRSLESQGMITRQREICKFCKKNKIVNHLGERQTSSQRPIPSKIYQKQEEIDFVQLVKNGENEFVEFKSSVLWSKNLTEEQLKAPTASREVRAFGREASKVIIAKAISGFLNTQGGNLVIGVKENKTQEADDIIGIESEFGKLEDQCTDGYRRMIVDNIIRKYFHPDIYNHFSDYIKITFPEIDEKILCWINISKSEVPAFVTIQKIDYFFIRLDAETRGLEGKQMVEYCKKRF